MATSSLWTGDVRSLNASIGFASVSRLRRVSSLHFDVRRIRGDLKRTSANAVAGFFVNQSRRRVSDFFYGKIASDRAALSSLIPSSADLTFPAERYIISGE